MRFPQFVVVVLAVTACGSGSAPTSSTTDAGSMTAADAGPTAAQVACAQESQARCMQMQTCEPIWLQVKYGDLATCEARFAISCNAGQDAPQTGQSPQLAQSCTTAISALSCADYMNGVTPTACMAPVGGLAAMTQCLANGQCSSQFCGIETGAQCGTCAVTPVAGAPCQDTSCGAALTCNTATNTCVAPVAAMGMCNASTPCGSGLSCVGATTTKMGACEPFASAVGQTCDPTKVTAPECDGRLGLFCQTTGPATARVHACAMGSVATAGQPCGNVNKLYVQCAGGATCKFPMNATTGVCQAPAADGTACDTTSGPNCLTPARCVMGTGTKPSGTAGTCELPDPAACPPS